MYLATGGQPNPIKASTLNHSLETDAEISRVDYTCKNCLFLTGNGFSQNPYPLYDAVLKCWTEHSKVSFIRISDHRTTCNLQEVNLSDPEQHVLNSSQLKIVERRNGDLF